MKLQVLLSFISIFYFMNNFNGWEFLEWQTKQDNVEKILQKEGIKYYQKGSIIKFDYQEMETNLYFDSLNRFIKVKQEADFHVNDFEESKIFFDKKFKFLKQKFGKEKSYADDKETEVITIFWETEYSKIKLTYDYQYKIIDEFGCCAYSIVIESEAIKKNE